jgi:large subunit ribosomal protein L23
MSTAPEAQKPAKGAKADVKAAPKVTAKSKAKAEAAAAEKAAPAAKPAKAPKAVAAKKPAVKKADAVKRSAHVESRLAQILIAPIISEKATMAAEKHNQVLFKVMRDATKPEIKAAVELMFKVTVDSVQTVQHKGKTKRFAKGVGRRDHVKKAYVCLAQGQELNFSGEGA